MSLEEAFWKGLKEIASSRRLTLSNTITSIDSGHASANLSSANRLFVLDHYRAQIGAAVGTRDAQTSAKDAPSLHVRR